MYMPSSSVTVRGPINNKFRRIAFGILLQFVTVGPCRDLCGQFESVGISHFHFVLNICGFSFFRATGSISLEALGME
jgi:hypothetical protein